MIHKLIKIANDLDQKGYYTEASELDAIIRTAVEEWRYHGFESEDAWKDHSRKPGEESKSSNPVGSGIEEWKYYGFDSEEEWRSQSGKTDERDTTQNRDDQKGEQFNTMGEWVDRVKGDVRPYISSGGGTTSEQWNFWGEAKNYALKFVSSGSIALNENYSIKNGDHPIKINVSVGTLKSIFDKERHYNEYTITFESEDPEFEELIDSVRETLAGVKPGQCVSCGAYEDDYGFCECGG